MKKMIFIVLVALLAVSCAVTMPVAATSNPVDTITKVGISKTILLFGIPLSRIPLSGDASIETAAKNGGINNISIVDVKTTSIFGVFTTIKTIVKGN